MYLGEILIKLVHGLSLQQVTLANHTVQCTNGSVEEQKDGYSVRQL
jgi:hypothetical protein